MSSVNNIFIYNEDTEDIWRAAIYYVATKGYTIYERVDTQRYLMCRTPSESLKRSAGQVIKITVTPLGPQKAQLVVLVTSYDERREKWIGQRLLRQPREELIEEVTSGIARLLPVVMRQMLAATQPVEPEVPVQRSSKSAS